MTSLVGQSKAKGMHPLTLSFLDSEQEANYQVQFMFSHRLYYRTGYLILLLFVVLFGFVEWHLFPQEFFKLSVIRYLISLPLLLLAAPFFLMDSVAQSSRFCSRLQKVLLFVTIVVMFMLAAMGLVLSNHMTSERALYGTLAYIITISFLFTTTRLRFVYATLQGLASLLALIVFISVLSEQTTFVFVSIVSFGLASNIFGSFACYLIEVSDRLHYLQGEQLKVEQNKVEELLRNVLPVEIAARLKNQEKIADSFDNATVLFVDIVGFTALSQKISPEGIVDLLNALFSGFDELVDKHGAEKIKTIGDAYMAAAGIPRHRSDHADVIAYLALDLQHFLKQFNRDYTYDLDLRMGIHSGPVVAGVIGRSRFLYDLWGDTVNTASRMESHGERGAIQVSDDSYLLMKERFLLEERGEIEVKGKGLMTTWWLQGKKADE